MSTTNRAFIKAYRHDAAQPSGHVQPNIGAEQRASARVGQAAVGGGRLQGRAVELREQTGRPRQAPMERRPLSSYITQPQITETPSGSTKEHVLEAGTTVASFHWPKVCRTLLQQSGPQLDHVIRVLSSRALAGNSLIGVLGMFPRLGATTAALCLASRAAGRGRRLILADCNFRNPRLASLLDAVPTAGWGDALKQSATLADATIHAKTDDLDILALGQKPIRDPEPLVSGLQAAVTAGVLRHSYDLTLLDLGAFFDPVSQPTLLELVANMGIDAAVAISGPEPADRRDVASIVEHLGNRGCELLGLIENRIAKPKAA
jgi:Mrp family chromosome partitioning ATPase